MKLCMEPSNLGYFEALASRTRLNVIRLLSERDMNIKELAETLDVSSSIMTKHVRKLESAGIIAASKVSRDGSRHKICTLLNFSAEICLPGTGTFEEPAESFRDTVVPVGQYTDIAASAPCGLADENRFLIRLDEPACMLAPERGVARMLWLGEGYVEYLVPKYPSGRRTSAIEIMAELASSAPGKRSGRGSGVEVDLNGQRLCTFLTPDFVETAQSSWIGQSRYGIMVVIRIDDSGLFINGERRSELTLAGLNAGQDRWRLRFGGTDGLTIFSGGCGNYGRDILFRSYYSNA